MNHLKILHDHLTSGTRANPGELPFVTISRQAGAGGHLLAYVLMTDMLKQTEQRSLFEGWHVFDKEITEIVAQDPVLRDAMDVYKKSHYKSETRNFLESLFSGRDNEYIIRKKTFEVIHLLSAIGKVIIVGRAGCCVTRHLPMGVHIRLVSPEPVRIKWVMRRFKVSESEARANIRREDRDRQRLFKTYFSRDIEDPLLYDAVWNTESADLHEIAQSVITLIKMRYERKERQPLDPSNRELADFFKFSI